MADVYFIGTKDSEEADSLARKVEALYDALDVETHIRALSLALGSARQS